MWIKMNSEKSQLALFNHMISSTFPMWYFDFFFLMGLIPSVTLLKFGGGEGGSPKFSFAPNILHSELSCLLGRLAML